MSDNLPAVGATDEDVINFLARWVAGDGMDAVASYDRTTAIMSWLQNVRRSFQLAGEDDDDADEDVVDKDLDELEPAQTIHEEVADLAIVDRGMLKSLKTRKTTPAVPKAKATSFEVTGALKVGRELSGTDVIAIVKGVTKRYRTHKNKDTIQSLNNMWQQVLSANTANWIQKFIKRIRTATTFGAIDISAGRVSGIPKCFEKIKQYMSESDRTEKQKILGILYHMLRQASLAYAVEDLIVALKDTNHDLHKSIMAQVKAIKASKVRGDQTSNRNLIIQAYLEADTGNEFGSAEYKRSHTVLTTHLGVGRSLLTYTTELGIGSLLLLAAALDPNSRDVKSWSTTIRNLPSRVELAVMQAIVAKAPQFVKLISELGEKIVDPLARGNYNLQSLFLESVDAEDLGDYNLAKLTSKVVPKKRKVVEDEDTDMAESDEVEEEASDSQSDSD